MHYNRSAFQLVCAPAFVSQGDLRAVQIPGVVLESFGTSWDFRWWAGRYKSYQSERRGLKNRIWGWKHSAVYLFEVVNTEQDQPYSASDKSQWSAWNERHCTLYHSSIALFEPSAEWVAPNCLQQRTGDLSFVLQGLKIYPCGGSGAEMTSTGQAPRSCWGLEAWLSTQSPAQAETWQVCSHNQDRLSNSWLDRLWLSRACCWATWTASHPRNRISATLVRWDASMLRLRLN